MNPNGFITVIDVVHLSSLALCMGLKSKTTLFMTLQYALKRSKP